MLSWDHVPNHDHYIVEHNYKTYYDMLGYPDIYAASTANNTIANYFYHVPSTWEKYIYFSVVAIDNSVKACSAPATIYYSPEDFTGIDEANHTMTQVSTTKYRLQHNYPNPFNSETTIHFDIPNSEQVEISIFDVVGKKICTLINETLPSGSHTLSWSGKNDKYITVPSGLYILRMQAGQFEKTQKLLLCK